MTSIAAAEPFGRTGSRARALLRGRADDPVWARPALAGLLLATAVLYLADLAASGYANSSTPAAVQAGAHSWKAFFFGSFDSSNFITVDKPPASLWVMDLSARLFGVSSWSILVPQALEGVAAVALLYATVRRRFSAPAALLSATVFALTPVALLMFRFNNPDALLTLLLVGAAYAVTRALEGARTRWLVLAGVLLGLGFLTKMMQSFIVVPGFAAVYLLAAPASSRRRLVQLLLSGMAMFAAAAWWVALVALWPAGSRPYIGGSQDNNILNLIFGYNGFGRITGNERGSVVGGRVFGATGGLGGGPGNGSGMWGPTGITRLFGGEMGTQISWLLPAALFFVVVLLAGMGRAPRTDGKRAAVLIWGSWLLRHGSRLQLCEGDHPPVLHGRPRTGDRGTGRDRRRVDVGAPRAAPRTPFACHSPRRDRGLGVRPARPDTVVASGRSLRRARRRRDHGCARGRGTTILGREPHGRARIAARCARRGARRAGRLLGGDRLHGPFRRASHGRTERICERGRRGGGGGRGRAFGGGGGPGFGFGPGAGNALPTGGFAGAPAGFAAGGRGAGGLGGLLSSGNCSTGVALDSAPPEGCIAVLDLLGVAAISLVRTVPRASSSGRTSP